MSYVAVYMEEATVAIASLPLEALKDAVAEVVTKATKPITFNCWLQIDLLILSSFA